MSTPLESVLEAAVAPLLADPDVALGRRKNCYEVGGKVFAMIASGRIVLKLPPARVQALVAEGMGEHYRLGARVMAEWIALRPDSAADAIGLAAEARRFVGG